MDKQQQIAKFERSWELFVKAFQGKLISQSAKQRLTPQLAQHFLTSTLTDWHSEYEIQGQWLCSLTSENPDLGKRISDVLYTVTVAPVAPAKGMPLAAKAGITAAAAAGAFGVAYVCGGGPIIRAIATIATAAVTYPITEKVSESRIKDASRKLIPAYVDQLQPFHDAILELLQ